MGNQADLNRDYRNTKSTEKGAAADSSASFQKSQEESADRLTTYARKTNRGGAAEGPPKQKPGESLGDYGARMREYRKRQQEAQSKGLEK